MCGICGVACGDPERESDRGVLEAMSAALAHRGPDDAGIWQSGGVSLAHRRLSILDPSPAGRQPMHSEDGGLVCVYNGEIYNFRELREELKKKGCRFRTECDTEVLVAACRTWGDAAIDRFNGIFAFALYDKRNRRLLLARDRLGVKPLFYTIQGDALAFASELSALRAGGFCAGPLNFGAIDAYFTFLYIPAPDTIYEGVHKLLPGEKLVFENGRIARERYWRLAYNINPGWTMENAADTYLGLLTDAVRLQRVSDVPLGAFLSGGLDSSSVVGLLSLMSEQPVKTFSIGFDDAHTDELRFARLAARCFQTDHTEAVLRPDMIDTVSRFARHFGEPFADSSALPTWLVSQVAREKVTVALSGDGGDELFAGYTWTQRNHQVGRYRRFPEALRRMADIGLGGLPSSPRTAKLRRFSRDSFLSPDAAFRRRLTCFPPELRAALYTRDMALAVSGSTVDRFQEHIVEAAGLSDDDRMLYVDTVMYLPDDILTKVDRMSMAHGLEVRVPLLDHRLVEFAATAPFTLKYARGISKRLVKRALRRLLPRELLRQRKQGFAIPIQRWFRNELRTHFEEAALDSSARSREYLSPKAVQALFRQHVMGQEDAGHQLWAILLFENWLRRERQE